MPYDIVDYARVLQKLIDSGTSFVSMTLVDIQGSAPQVIGAKAIASAAGIEWGTIGGGKVEAAAAKYAYSLLNHESPSTELVTWNLQTDIGMTCGGEVKILFETQAASAWPIVVYGAGHVAQALVRLLLQLNCHVTCVDTRQQWLDKLPDDSKLKKFRTDVPRETVASQPSDAFFVLMSKGHATDLPVLAEILRTRKAPYIGVIGSRQKASVLRRDLKQQGLTQEQIESFHCPMGLPIGNNTPAEIAISVAAQLLEQRDV